MPEHWKVVLLLMHLTDPETIRRTTEEIRYGEACEEFERWAEGCPYLVFEEYGNATEHICLHPDRNDPTEWVMCDINLCPLKPLKLMNQERMTCAMAECRKTCHNISEICDENGRQICFVCSECDAWIDSHMLWGPEYPNGESVWVKDCKLNYCPNCGARIRYE